MSILKKPEPPKKPNPSEQRLFKAKELIEAKRYDDARALLITIDHPTADKWLERLDKFAAPPAKPIAIPVAPAPLPTGEHPSFTNKFVVVIVLLFLLFIPGLIALVIFSEEAKRYPDAPGAGALLLLNKWLFGLLLALLLLFVLFIFLTRTSGGTNIYTLF